MLILMSVLRHKEQNVQSVYLPDIHPPGVLNIPAGLFASKQYGPCVHYMKVDVDCVMVQLLYGVSLMPPASCITAPCITPFAY